MRSNHFTRPTISAAFSLISVAQTQAGFEQMVLRLGQEAGLSLNFEISVGRKSVMLHRLLLTKPDEVIQTVDGQITLVEAVVREAVALAIQSATPRAEQAQLVRALALDGFIIDWSSDYPQVPMLRASLPPEIDLPAADDEVHALLRHFGFATTVGHLDQSIEAHTRGDWAAANSQARTTIESLFDEIANSISVDEATAASNSENQRALLAAKGFFSVDRKEWSTDGKSYIHGLNKMLHSDGSHPGLSDEDHSTFRLHVVMVTARLFLRRLYNRC